MGREIDESWVEEAIARYRRIEDLQAQFDVAVARTEVTVRSPDDLVEVLVRADGSIREVTVVGSLVGRTNVEISRSIQAAMESASGAAEWARRTLYAETFGGYAPLGRS